MEMTAKNLLFRPRFAKLAWGRWKPGSQFRPAFIIC